MHQPGGKEGGHLPPGEKIRKAGDRSRGVQKRGKQEHSRGRNVSGADTESSSNIFQKKSRQITFCEKRACLRAQEAENLERVGVTGGTRGCSNSRGGRATEEGFHSGGGGWLGGANTKGPFGGNRRMSPAGKKKNLTHKSWRGITGKSTCQFRTP